MSRTLRRHRFVFLCSNETSWGGSEALWADAATALAEAGHHVTICKSHIDETQPAMRRLRALGCHVRDFATFPLPRPLYDFLARASYPVIAVLQILRTAQALALTNPDLVIVSQGVNADGLPMANIARRMKKPYVLIAQKATEMYWPHDSRLRTMRAVYGGALAAYFVSEHNRRLTEEQLGHALPHAAIARNPYLVPWEPRRDWPAEGDGLRLACIGRLYVSEKGQDLLLRVLAREHWRRRALFVDFYGEGPNRRALEAMAAFHGVKNVSFLGHTKDVVAIWNDHHGLILPSRCEGLPLVLVEAMLSGRVAIATDVAGNREIVRDGETGFLAAAATEDALDAALERAWQRRAEWRSIGAAAAEAIRELVPRDPGADLAQELLRVATGAVRELQTATNPA